MNVTYIDNDRIGVAGDFYGTKGTETPDGYCPDCGEPLEDITRGTQLSEGCVFDGSYDEVVGEICPICFWRRMYEEEK